jgi:LysM repeat protein
MGQVTINVGGKPVTVNETTPGLFGSLGYTYVSGGGSTTSSPPTTTSTSSSSSSSGYSAPTYTTSTSGGSSSGGSSGTSYTQVVSSPSSNYQTYTIKPGDTLSGIAAKYGTTVPALMKANPSIPNKDTIYAGANLVIPTATSTPTTNSVNNLNNTYTQLQQQQQLAQTQEQLSQAQQQLQTYQQILDKAKAAGISGNQQIPDYIINSVPGAREIIATTPNNQNQNAPAANTTITVGGQTFTITPTGNAQ